MSSTLDINTFRQLLNGKTIDVARAGKDDRLGGLDLSKVDLNRDGQIATKAEIDALFHQIDNADKNGSRNSVRVAGKDGQPNTVATLIKAVGDIAGVDILGEMAHDDIIIVGMNADSKIEAAALKRAGRNVIYIHDSNEDDKITIRGTRYDLREPAELKKFVALLGLPGKQSDDIAAAIASSSSDAADELASIAWNWAPAEKGFAIPARLVISGHSFGEGVFGYGNGNLKRDVIAALAKAMPKAAGRVEDLHISGCYSAGAFSLTRWRTIFPNVLTIWAYSGSAPSSGGGAAKHLVLWDHATQGSKGAIDRLVAAKTTNGESVAVWSRSHGYDDGKPLLPIPNLKALLSQSEPTFTACFAGTKVEEHPQHGELRDYYNIVQSLLQHPDLPANDRPALERKRDVTIRLIFYLENIRGKFATTHARLITAGYKALGLAAPDFSSLSRKDALAAIARFTDAMQSNPAAPADARTLRPMLEYGLRDLLPGQIPAIPDNWI